MEGLGETHTGRSRGRAFPGAALPVAGTGRVLRPYSDRRGGGDRRDDEETVRHRADGFRYAEA